MLSNVPAKGVSELSLAFGHAAIASGPSSELGELFLLCLCKGVCSDSGGKGRAARGRAVRCTEQTDRYPMGTLQLAVNGRVNFHLPWSCCTQNSS